MDDQSVTSLAGDWRQAGIRNGDLVLIHSSLRRTVRRCVQGGMSGAVGDILESFREAVGDTGTLLFPLFNFQFTEGVPFRTGHPIYSFAVIGARAPEFAGIDNHSGYGADSPFAKLRELGGRIAILDLPDQHSMTFYHHVEEMKDVPYRFHKTFAGDYTDASGLTSRREYGLFVRDLEKGVRTDVDPMGELLWEQSLYTGDRPGEGTGLRVIDVNPLFDSVSRVIDDGRAEGLLYSIAHDS
jgi:aminoglycoside 3-N-acetyltransferase